MKKIILLSLALIIVVCSVYSLPVSALDDFVVEDGVLLEYKGSYTDVTIPSDVYFIGDNAFKDNKTLRSVMIHSGVTDIGNKAFFGCTSLTDVNNASAVVSVGAYAFTDTPFLNNSTDSILRVGGVAVSGNVKGELVLPQGTVSIAPYAFCNNSQITSFKSVDSLNSIGEGAFYNCSGLSDISVSNSVSYIGPFAFEGTKYLNNTSDEFVILGDGILYAYTGKSSKVTLPQQVKQVGAGAFRNNSTVTSVNLTDSVTSIGMRSFMNCSKLKEVQYTASLVMIDKEAFAGCKALEEFTVFNTVKIVGESAFYGCSGLEFVNYYSSSDLPDGAFAGCDNLEYVIISSSLSSFGRYSFYECSSLKEVSVPDTVRIIDGTAFSNTSGVCFVCHNTSKGAEYAQRFNIKFIQCGDTNLDEVVNIRDATAIQKSIAGMIELSVPQRLRAETLYDGVVNIKDATLIQKRCAGIE